jgi:hypothetical protein
MHLPSLVSCLRQLPRVIGMPLLTTFLAVTVLPVGESGAVLGPEDVLFCRNVSTDPGIPEAGVCAPDVQPILEFGVPRFRYTSSPKVLPIQDWFDVSFLPSAIILTFTEAAFGNFATEDENVLLLADIQPVPDRLVEIEEVRFVGTWNGVPSEDPSVSNSGLPNNQAAIRWDLVGAIPSAGDIIVIDLDFNEPGGIAAVATGKDGGNATFFKLNREGPVQYQVCGTCPAPGICFDDIGDPMTLTDEAVRVTVSNFAIGKAKEEVTTKEIRYEYEEEGSNDLKKGVPSFVKIEIFDDVGDLDVSFACDPSTIKKSKLDVDFDISRLKGKGSAQINFVTDILTSCGVEADTLTKILDLCGGKNKVLSVSNNGKKLKIKIKNGTVTGLDLDPDLPVDPNL